MLMPLDRSGVIKTIFDRAPKFLLCCDDFTQGVHRQIKSKAFLKRNVQIDKLGCCSVILIDIDRRGAATAHEDVGLPPPSWSCTNPKNGHAHVAYVLDEPIWRTDSVMDRPVRLLRAVRHAMITMLGGDQNYAARLTKNPLHPDWIVDIINKTYTLSELMEYIPNQYLESQKKFRAQDEDTYTQSSRNKSVFDVVRLRHYSEWSKLVLLPKRSLVETLLATARQANVFPEPLTERELITICRSIARFMRNRYRASTDSDAFKSRQSYRQRLAAKQRRQNNNERIGNAALALAINGVPLTFSSIAKQAGLTRQTAASTHREHCLSLIQKFSTQASHQLA